MGTQAGQAAGSEIQTDWPTRPGLVFIGLAVLWRRQVADLRMNMALAEQWSNRFATWSATDRTIGLIDPAKRIGVTLEDGSAQFEVESDAALHQAISCIDELIGTLRERGTKAVHVHPEAQYLHEVEAEFEELVRRIGPKFVGSDIIKSVGTELTDFAFLVDVRYKGESFQINAGPVRAKEVRRRVAARFLPHIPKVAAFVKVTGSVPMKSGELAVMPILEMAFELGSSVQRELMK